MSAIQMHYLKQMKRLKYKITLARILLFAGFITLWEVAAYASWIDDFIFSSPSRIIKTLFAMISDGSIFYHTAVTVAETGISFALIVLLGVGTAILLWSSKTISAVLEPYLVLLNSLPKSALAPMIIVWLGNNAKAIIVTAISVGVFGTILKYLHQLCRNRFRQNPADSDFGRLKKKHFNQSRPALFIKDNYQQHEGQHRSVACGCDYR